MPGASRDPTLRNSYDQTGKWQFLWELKTDFEMNPKVTVFNSLSPARPNTLTSTGLCPTSMDMTATLSPKTMMRTTRTAPTSVTKLKEFRRRPQDHPTTRAKLIRDTRRFWNERLLTTGKVSLTYQNYILYEPLWKYFFFTILNKQGETAGHGTLLNWMFVPRA